MRKQFHKWPHIIKSSNTCIQCNSVYRNMFYVQLFKNRYGYTYTNLRKVKLRIYGYTILIHIIWSFK